MNQCEISVSGFGYCGLRKNVGGTLMGVSAEKGKLLWYHDPLPTNCVADWVCPVCTGIGFPVYAYSSGPEYGYRNFAVFFNGCSFNCLYCQNWHFKQRTFGERYTSPEQIISDVNRKNSCICFFGGDPTPQLPFALRVAQSALVKSKGRIFRIYWETNGSMNETLFDEMMTLTIRSGGCIKFDLKAWNENLHYALTDVSNKRTIKNFVEAGKKLDAWPMPPLLVASTPLVPGYIDKDEIHCIAKFIASVNPDIPYNLLSFFPHFYMYDMPLTPHNIAEECVIAAKEEGLTNVKIGNAHLLA